MTGPKAFYRHKTKPLNAYVTDEAFRIAEGISRRTGRKAGDICEQLLRRFGGRVQFPDQETT